MELEDLPWSPRAVHDGGTGWLRFMAPSTRRWRGPERGGLGVLFVLAQLPVMLLLTPFVRPFSWKRLALTYRMFRLYPPDELALVAAVDGHASFDWDIGFITHLIGTPPSRSAAEP